jgi:PAS domain S-box-containing protein
MSHLAHPRSPWVQLGLLLSVAIGYSAAFIVGFPALGMDAAVPSVFVVALAAWVLGPQSGLLASLGLLLINTFLLNRVGYPGWDALIRAHGLVHALYMLLAAVAIGRLKQETTRRLNLEASLRQTEERARLLAELPFEAIAIHDQGIIVEANQSFCRMYGFEPSEIVGISALELTAPEFRPVVQQKIAAGDTNPYEGIALRKDGTPFYVELIGKPVSLNGRMVRVTAIHDITKRKRAEEELREYSADLEIRIQERTADLHRANEQLQREIAERKQSESLLRKIIDILPDHIFTKDRQSRFLLINRSAAQDIGYDNPDDLIGKTDFDNLPKEVAQTFYDEEQQMMQTGEPLLNIEQMNIYTQDWYQTTKMPLRDEQGNIIGLVGIARNITDRKRALEVLKNANDELERRVAERTTELSEANASLRQQMAERKRIEEILETERNLLRALVDNLPHFVYYKDAQTRFVITNDATARGFGLARDQIIGKSDLDLHPRELAQRFHAKEMHVLQTGQPLIDHEEMVIDDRGRAMWLLTNKIPVRDKNGQIIGLVGFSIDITERKQIEAQKLELALAKEKTNFLKNFLNNISHDFKTPLSIMNTSLYLLEKSNDPDYRSIKIETLKAQVQHLQHYIQDILTISRLDSLPEMTTQPLDVNLLIQEVEKQFHTVAEKKHLKIHLALGVDLPLVTADADELKRAFVNMLENALRYTPDGGSITLRTAASGQRIHVDIQDTGIGIGESDLPYIFESFYRADKARAMDTGGTGLGLAIVKRIIEMHQGTITVESAPGVGSTFHIQLPAMQ